MKKNILFLFVVLVVSLSSRAQSPAQPKEQESYHKGFFGLGFGMDYGGLGVKVQYLPIKYLGVFAGLGYNLYGLGVNGGIHFRPLPDAKVQPLALAMYGYNGVIKIDGSDRQLQMAGLEHVNGTYYGFTAGIGGELKTGKKGNRFSISVLYPFRNKKFLDNYDNVKNSPAVKLDSDLLPVTFSIGFNWVIE